LLDKDRGDGAVSANGRVAGTYVHGLFTDDGFRKAYLKSFGAKSGLAYDRSIDLILDELAQHLEMALDVEAILNIAKNG
ncbi:MAG: cobyric acid synthase CobQ, partial [Roseibium sp.]|nr:cobyric acid synthase CobQ [Roseibium sp.]